MSGKRTMQTALDEVRATVEKGGAFVMIAEPEPGHITVTGNATTEWLISILEAVLDGAKDGAPGNLYRADKMIYVEDVTDKPSLPS